MTSVKGSSGAILSLEAYPNHIAHVNPIRYRGYYYDNETGFYYLQSRYYDPVISRFINADSYGSTGQGFLGTNMFAYCLNNPVNFIDQYGQTAIAIPDAARDWELVLEYITGAGICINPVAGIGIFTLLHPQQSPKLKFSDKIETSAAVAAGAALTCMEAATASKPRYVVYLLCAKGDSSQTIIYVGRVKEEGLQARMAYHRSKGRTLVHAISGLSYEACRGLEQTLMAFYHCKSRGNPLYNQINGISSSNPKLPAYFGASEDYISKHPGCQYLPTSYWMNQYEELLLNGIIY